MKNIETLIFDGGDISIGALYPIACVFTAASDNGTVAMLVRRDGETLTALLKRLDHANGRFYDHDEILDEVSRTRFPRPRVHRASRGIPPARERPEAAGESTGEPKRPTPAVAGGRLGNQRISAGEQLHLGLLQACPPGEVLGALEGRFFPRCNDAFDRLFLQP